MTIKCKCGEEECRIEISIEKDVLFFRTNEGETNLIYLDANSIVNLIKELRKALIEMTEEN